MGLRCVRPEVSPAAGCVPILRGLCQDAQRPGWCGRLGAQLSIHLLPHNPAAWPIVPKLRSGPVTRYKFMLRPVSSFHIPHGVECIAGTHRAEPDTPHGSVELSRELTATEMRHFDVYPAHWSAADIKTLLAERE